MTDELDNRYAKYEKKAADIDAALGKIKKEMEADAKKWSPTLFGWLAVVFVLVVWLLGTWIPYGFHIAYEHGFHPSTWSQVSPSSVVENPQPNNDLTNWGQTGDSFGAANALFSGFAFAFVIVAILLQYKELKLQRLAMREAHCETALARLEYEQLVDTQRDSEKQLKHQSRLMAVSNYLSSLTAISPSQTELAGLEGIYKRQIREVYMSIVEKVASRLSSEANELAQEFEIDRGFALSRLAAICRATISLLKDRQISLDTNNDQSAPLLRRELSKIVRDLGWLSDACKQSGPCTDIEPYPSEILSHVCPVLQEVRRLEELSGPTHTFDPSLVHGFNGTRDSTVKFMINMNNSIEKDLEEEFI